MGINWRRRIQLAQKSCIMASEGAIVASSSLEILQQIQATLQTVQQNYQQLCAAVQAIDGRINTLTGIKQVQEAADQRGVTDSTSKASTDKDFHRTFRSNQLASSSPSTIAVDGPQNAVPEGKLAIPARSHSTQYRIILTTYPGQSGIDPIEMRWGHANPGKRGPVVVSRSQSTVRRRNGKFSSCFVEHSFLPL